MFLSLTSIIEKIKKKKTELNNDPTNCSTRLRIWFYWEFNVRFQLAFAQRGAISTAYPYDNVLTANLTWLSSEPIIPNSLAKYLIVFDPTDDE